MLLTLTGVKHITIIDCTSPFLMLKLTYNSSLLTAFRTIYGRYRYERMPMGARPSSDIFQMTFDHIFTPEEYPFLCNIADDIIIVSYDEGSSDHDRNVCEGVKFNPDKYLFCSESIPFFGMNLSKEGMIPDPKKTTLAKLQLPSPVKEMHSFLGMVNYLGRFTPRLALLTAPLRKIIKKENAYAPMFHH